MGFIQDYKIISAIDETSHAIIYRCKKEGDGKTYIIKVFKTRYPTKSEIARFKHEYQLIKNISNDGVVKTFDFIEHNEQLALVMEDFNGTSLKKILKAKKTSIDGFLLIAEKISATLGAIHKDNIVHKDIKPNNILIHAQSGAVKLIDFGISSVITHENDEIYNQDVIDGTLVYMSPEQTGRINRRVDYRTDFYSLGITFYEMLSGKVPFISDDPMEIIHSHLARRPVPLCEVDESIPPVISRIVDKLMAKTPEERYQNSFGLHADIKKCIDLLGKNGEIEDFTIAENDVSLKFNIPQLFVGRSHELEILISHFDHVSKGEKKLILVKGEPGIGKSAFINEIYKPIMARRGYFVTGKYEQYKRNVPYSSIIQALQSLIRQILTEREDRIYDWKSRLVAALGPNGKIICDVIPDIEMIIGKQPDVAELGIEESQNRFKLVFKNFIGIFATWEHPLVIFLDDLQWADSASLDILKLIATDPEINYVLIIGAYRQNELNSSNTLTLMLDEIGKQLGGINTITLGPLSIENVSELLINFLHSNKEESYELAELIERKTNGNPFFILQFLKTLYEEGMIRIESKGWKWNIDRIRQMQVTENVGMLLEKKITSLPMKTVEVLKTCACIGNRFELEVISQVMHRSIDEILASLDISIREDLVSPANDLYRFNHDRIQEAVYSIISEEEKSSLHYQIGKIVLEKTTDKNLSDKIFFIVHHLNSGQRLITGHDEKLTLARLNMTAGDKARTSNAYISAAGYYEIALSILPASMWEVYYEMTFACTRDLGICEHLNGRLEKAESIFNIAVSHATSDIDKASLFNLTAILRANQGKHAEATKIAIKGLRILGISIPDNPGKLSIMKELVRTKIKLKKINSEQILGLPRITEKKILMAVDLYMTCIASSYFSDKNVQVYATLAMLRLMLGHGNCEGTSFALISYFYIEVIGLKNYRTGLKYGKLSLKMNEKYFHPAINAKVYSIYGMGVSIIDEPLEKAIEYEKEAFKTTLEAGDIRFAIYSEQILIFNMLALGTDLGEIADFANKHLDFVLRAKDPGAINYNYSVIQYIKSLKGNTDNPKSFDDADFSEAKLLQDMYTDNIPIILQRHFLHRAQGLYLFEDYQGAYDAILESEKYIEASLATICESDHNFFYSLILAALARKDGKAKKSFVKTAIKNQKQMKQWAGFYPHTFEHKYLLVEAELASIAGDLNKAGDLYHQAVISAKEAGFIHHAAIAAELYAKYHMAKGHMVFASIYLANAIYWFERWGAPAKVEHIKEKYHDLIGEREHLQHAYDDTGTGYAARKTPAPQSMSDRYLATPERTSDRLDFSTALKASQTISGEIVLPKLLEKLLKILIENAGAEKGFLIFESNGVLTVEAAGGIDNHKISVLQSLPLAECTDLSAALVQFVMRTRESIVINDASNNKLFASDPYISQKRPKSILCTPIINQGKVSAVLYLENGLTENAFLPERLQLLSVISSQAAVSIDNARLYANLEEMVTERTLELKKARDALWGEMKLAKKIQTILLPEDPVVAGYEVLGHMTPAAQIGGDYYDIINHDGIDWIIIGDVSGHGVLAGLLMMMTQTAMQTTIRNNPRISPTELLFTVNRAISYNIRKLKEDKYITITAFSFRPDGKVVHSGLHQNILIYRTSTGTVQELETDGLWLGYEFDMARDNKDKSFDMRPDDVLLLYTDGVTEARDIIGGLFGLDNLTDILRRTGGQSLTQIRDEIFNSLAEYKKNDDVTLLLIKKKG